MITRARLSFPHLAEPQTQTDKVTGNKRVTYNCDLLLEPNDPAFGQFMQQYAKLAQAKWLENAGNAMQQIQANRKQRCYGTGEEKVDSKTFQVRKGYAGKVYISASSKNMPQMIQPDGRPTDPANTMACQMIARKMYGGCYINAVVKPWLQQNDTGIGIRADLVAVQFAADGEPFGEGVVDASAMFGAVAGAAPVGMPVAPVFGAVAPAPAPFPGIPGVPSFLG
jgi:hypothetical protein